MYRMIGAVAALLGLALAAPATAQSWSIVHEVAGVEGAASVRWRLWQSDAEPAELMEEVTAEVSVPVCIGLVARPIARIDTSRSIGGFIVPMAPRNGRLQISRLYYAAGQTFRGQAAMRLVQRAVQPDGSCVAQDGLNPARVDALRMLPRRTDAEISAGFEELMREQREATEALNRRRNSGSPRPR